LHLVGILFPHIVFICVNFVNPYGGNSEHFCPTECDAVDSGRKLRTFRDKSWPHI